MNREYGLTIIELLISVAILVIILALGIIVLNPVAQFASARNSQRRFHIESVLNSIRSNIAATRTGVFTCSNGDIPTTTKRMASGPSNYNIAPCLVPNYLQNMPFDPSATSSYYSSVTDYNTGYDVLKNASTGEITVSAPFAESGKTISVTR